MKKFIQLLIFLFSVSQISAQYTTDYPFDSDWVTNFNGRVFNIVDLGAIPNDEINDSPYFRMAADSIQHYGTGKLIIPSGLYIVGEQNINPNPNSQEQYYQNNEIFNIEGVNNVIIEGETGTKIKIRDGLRFGSFHPLTGEAYHHEPDTVQFTTYEYRADVGDIFLIENSNNIYIKNLELDGNNENLILGGYYAETSAHGKQTEATGIKLMGSTNAKIQNIHTHHHGLDGIEITHYNLTPTSNPTVVVLENINSEYNGRQGLSWVGGIGLTAYNCKFNHTGKANILSPPASGVDIEAEDSVCRGGKFINCELINNGNSALVSASGDGGYSTFENCTFWGNTSASLSITKPALYFENCQIYGSMYHAFGSSDDASLATKFTNCHFEDLEHPDYGVFRANYLIDINENDLGNVTFDNCTIVANEIKSIWITNELNVPAYVKNTTITHKKQIENHDFIANFRRVSLENVQFTEEYPAVVTDVYFINIQDDVDVGNCVTLENQHVKWESWDNDTMLGNWILPGHYPMQNTLELLTPSVGETLSVGNVYNVTWNVDNSNDFVEIQLFKGCEFLETIENTTENDGLYAWTVSSDISTANDYRMKILNKNNLQDFDYNPTEFSISNPSAGTNDIINGNELHIYPNPFNDRVFISYTLKEKPEKINIKVKNLLGKTISETNIENQDTVGNMEIKLNNFASGLYLLEFYDNLEMLKSFKIIKL